MCWFVVMIQWINKYSELFLSCGKYLVKVVHYYHRYTHFHNCHYYLKFFSLKYLFFLLHWPTGSSFIVSRGIFHCSTWSLVGAWGLTCFMACGILVPWPSIEQASPALQARFLTSGSLGKSQPLLLLKLSSLFWLCMAFV